MSGLEGTQLLLAGLGGCQGSQSSLWHWGRLRWGTGQARGRIQPARRQLLELGKHLAAREIQIWPLGGE